MKGKLMSHTPGTWYFEPDVCAATQQPCFHIGTKEDKHTVGITYEKSDACLVAAAPDLLAAIKEVMEDLHAAHVAGSYQIPPSSAAMAFDAIEKATGEKTCGSQMT